MNHRYIEVPYDVIQHVEVTREVPVDVIREIEKIKEVTCEVSIEVIREKVAGPAATHPCSAANYCCVCRCGSRISCKSTARATGNRREGAREIQCLTALACVNRQAFRSLLFHDGQGGVHLKGACTSRGRAPQGGVQVHPQGRLDGAALFDWSEEHV